MNEELDSQLSAMFDDELPPAECELLARRLSRDEQLKARWGRYAVIGATIRSERGVRLNAGLAVRVNAVISSEPALTGTPAPQRAGGLASKWWQPIAGVAVAAGVATLSILWMRSQALPEIGSPLAPMTASTTRAPSAVATSKASASEPDSYVVPPTPERRIVVPSTELANYVVAHSEFSSPVTRRNLLSAFMASESGTAGTSAGSEEPTEDVQQDDAKDAKNTQ
jgi:sigma-E factor negative regulatory protein RseA